MRLLVTILLACSLSGRTQAQYSYTITLDLRISDPVLEPGESQHVEVWALLDPSPPGWYWIPSKGEECEVYSLGQARLGVINLGNAETGVWSDLKANPMIFATYPGDVRANGSVENIFALQWDQAPIKGAPMFVWSATWTPDDSTPRLVRLQTSPTKPNTQWAMIHCKYGTYQYDAWTPIRTTVEFRVGCPADCDSSGSLDVFDFLCFQTEFANHTAYADCEADGDWDVFDFLCFQGLYADGCP